jgi:hypothetical protein
MSAQIIPLNSRIDLRESSEGLAGEAEKTLIAGGDDCIMVAILTDRPNTSLRRNARA